MGLHTISSSEKNSVWTEAGFLHTQEANWASDWTVHSRRKKLARLHSQILLTVRRIWQHRSGSSDLSMELCRSMKAVRFFTVEPGRGLKVTEKMMGKSF